MITYYYYYIIKRKLKVHITTTNMMQ